MSTHIYKTTETIQDIIGLINFPLTVKEITPHDDDFPEDSIEAYDIDGFILSNELRSSPRVAERKEYRWVVTVPIVYYDRESGYDYDYKEIFDGPSLCDAILEITNEINRQKIQSYFESKMEF